MDQALDLEPETWVLVLPCYLTAAWLQAISFVLLGLSFVLFFNLWQEGLQCHFGLQHSMIIIDPEKYETPMMQIAC